MSKLASKNKIYILIALWFIVVVTFFAYFVNILQDSNEGLEQNLAQQQSTLRSLENEQKSYVQGKNDLAKVETELIQPDDLFSKDINLVKEVETLERLSQTYGVTMSLNGLTGTLKTISPAKMKSGLFVVPASLNLKGSLDQVVLFLDHVEHLGFVTKVNNVAINSEAEGQVSMSISINFYLRP